MEESRKKAIKAYRKRLKEGAKKYRQFLLDEKEFELVKQFIKQMKEDV